MTAKELLKELNQLTDEEKDLPIAGDIQSDTGEVTKVGIFPDFVILE